MNQVSNSIPTVPADRLKFLSTEEMIEVDRLMTDVLKIELMQMMENAGRNLARLCVQRFLQTSESKHVVVLAGTGGNGGGALVAARRLHQWGFDVMVLTSKLAESYTGVPAHQLGILKRLGIEPIEPDVLSDFAIRDLDMIPDLIVDGLIGYSLHGNPRGRIAALIEWANNIECPILALDTPSGIDVTTGKAGNPVVDATATLTLALPKQGLISPEAAPLVGELYLGDIGVPDWVYREMGIEFNIGSLFQDSDILQVDLKKPVESNQSFELGPPNKT